MLHVAGRTREDAGCEGIFFRALKLLPHGGIAMNDSPEISRRRLLKGVVLWTGASLAAGLGAGNALAQQKVPKESMKYQDKPNGDKRWSNCARFVARMAARSSQEPSVHKGLASPGQRRESSDSTKIRRCPSSAWTGGRSCLAD